MEEIYFKVKSFLRRFLWKFLSYILKQKLGLLIISIYLRYASLDNCFSFFGKI